MGDVVLTTAVIDSLRSLHPEYEIDLLTSDQYAPLFVNDDRISELFTYRKSGVNSNLRSRLLARTYDYVADLQGNARSRLISRGIGRKRAVYSSQALRRRAIVKLKMLHLNPARHAVERYATAFTRLGIRIDPRGPSIRVPDHEVEGFLKEQGLSKHSKPVALVPGAKWPAKMWPLSYFVELGRLIDFSPLIAVGHSSERAILDRLEQETSGKVVACETPDVGKLAAAIGSSAVVISNDSGPMHLATALDIPVVAIFGPTSLDLGFRPLGRRVAVLERELPCRPCHVHGGRDCRLDRRTCMESIAPDEVLEKVKAFVEEKQSNVQDSIT
jgi:heptosyltransferase-2